MTRRMPDVPLQLRTGSPTKGSDCNVVSTVASAEWATYGQAQPLDTPEAVRAAIVQVRQAMGVPTGGTLVSSARDVLRGMGVGARYVTDPAEVEAALKAGMVAQVAVNYAWVNKHAVYLSGQRGLDAWHAVLLWGWETARKGRRWVTWLDPLHDNRRPNIPMQVVNARWADALGAMKRGDGRVMATLVRPNPPAQPVQGVPQAQYDAVVATLKARKAAMDTALPHVAAAYAALEEPPVP